MPRILWRSSSVPDAASHQVYHTSKRRQDSRQQWTLENCTEPAFTNYSAVIDIHQQMPEDSATHQAEEQDFLDDALVTWNFLILEAKIIRG